MLLGERIELAPQLCVLHRLAIARAPAVAFPAVDPALDAVLDVLRVEIELDVARALQRLERANDGGELHAVVGRVPLAAVELLLAAVEDQERSPPARTRIALARAVGVDDDRPLSRQRDRRLCVVRLSRAPAAGASAFLRRSRRCHAGVSRRMPSTFFVARRK